MTIIQYSFIFFYFDDKLQEFDKKLHSVLLNLAKRIAADGEGASKFVSVNVLNAKTFIDAKNIAFSIANSPLVKTAIAGEDPNWGRILAAVGRAGVEDLAVDKLQIYLGNVLLVENGGRASSYSEQAGQAVMNETDITIRVILDRGKIAETVWTTDFSYDYVKINAEYRS